MGIFMLQVGTPDSMAESMLPSVVDPRDYDHLRFMQVNGGTGNNFEETIHRVSNGSFFPSMYASKLSQPAFGFNHFKPKLV
jgi:hypothetical protein